MPRVAIATGIVFGALGALVFASPTRAEWVDWIADAQLDARFDTNLNHASRSSEGEWDLTFHPSVAFGRVYQLGERTRVSAVARLEGEIHSRFDDLDAVTAGSRVSLSHKLGVGDAPWVQAFASGGYQHVDAAQRRGPRFEAGAELGKRLSSRMDVRLSYAFARRYGQNGPRVVAGVPDDVFDQRSHSISLRGSWLARERLLLSAGFTYRRGDFDSNARASRNAILASTDVKAVARDEVFGGWVYRIRGNGYSPFANLSWALGDRWSVDATYRYGYSEGHGLSYHDHTIGAAVLFRY